jgi:hypothetical protein
MYKPDDGHIEGPKHVVIEKDCNDLTLIQGIL